MADDYDKINALLNPLRDVSYATDAIRQASVNHQVADILEQQRRLGQTVSWDNSVASVVKHLEEQDRRALLGGFDGAVLDQVRDVAASASLFDVMAQDRFGDLASDSLARVYAESTSIRTAALNAVGNVPDAIMDAARGSVAHLFKQDIDQISGVAQWRDQYSAVLDSQYNRLTHSVAALGLLDRSALDAIASASLGVNAAKYLEAELANHMAQADAWKVLKPAVDTLIDRWSANSAIDAVQAYLKDAQALYRDDVWKQFIDVTANAMYPGNEQEDDDVEISDDAPTDGADLDPTAVRVAIGFGMSQFRLEMKLGVLATRINPLTDVSAGFHERVVVVAQAYPKYQTLLLNLAVRLAARLKWPDALKGAQVGGRCEAITMEDADEFARLVTEFVAVIDTIEQSRK